MAFKDQPYENFQFPEEVLPKGNSLYDLSKQDNHSLQKKIYKLLQNPKTPPTPK